MLVFQEGVGADLFGFGQVDRIEAWVPVFLFSVLFGLSMDYQVFLLSRIKERFSATGDTTAAIVFGVGSTARLITGAALIIIAVFAGFAAGELVAFQQMGFGVAVALLIDATIVRLVVIPAAMGLLGERTGTSPPGLNGYRTLRSRIQPSPQRLQAAPTQAPYPPLPRASHLAKGGPSLALEQLLVDPQRQGWVGVSDLLLHVGGVAPCRSPFLAESGRVHAGMRQWRLRRSDQPGADGCCGGCAACGLVELGPDAGHVAVDGVGAEHQPLGDLGVAEAFGD